MHSVSGFHDLFSISSFVEKRYKINISVNLLCVYDRCWHLVVWRVSGLLLYFPCCYKSCVSFCMPCMCVRMAIARACMGLVVLLFSSHQLSVCFKCPHIGIWNWWLVGIWSWWLDILLMMFLMGLKILWTYLVFVQALFEFLVFT